jgi:hypothetical protein
LGRAWCTWVGGGLAGGAVVKLRAVVDTPGRPVMNS